MIDKLIEKIDALKNPSLLGLDTAFDYLPEGMTKGMDSLEDAAKAVEEFNVRIIDKVYPIIPAVKVQVAYYEMLGAAGMIAFKNTLSYAKSKGLVTIADVKRNDIGSTAECYSKAFLGKTKIGGKEFSAFDSDFATVNGYLGEDGIIPFVSDCKAHDKGIFVLCKTSNPSSSQLQNLRVKDDGEPAIFEKMGALIEQWGADTRGKFGYSKVGAVVGATHPREAEILRAQMPHTFFLVPGYGAQGGTAADLKVFFDKNARGAIVNNSRGLLCAYRQDKYKGMDFAAACYAAANDMREALYKVLY